MSTESTNATSARPIRKIWLGAFIGFFLVFGAWALAAPFDGPPDEVQHVIRAAGVVSGQLAPEPVVIDNWNGKGDDGMGAYQQVPEGLHSPATCWGFDAHKTAACATPIHGGPVTAVPTSAGRYNPAYYLAVGAPVRLWPGWGGLVLSRLLSAAFSAALLAFAFAVLVRWSRFGLMLAALIAVSTPMLAHLAGAVNPNGIEISAGIALFAAGIPMLYDNRPLASKTPLYWLFGVSAVILATVRSLGPLWMVCAVGALLLGISRSQLRELWSNKVVRRWGYTIGAALLLSVGWILVMRTGEVVPPDGVVAEYGIGRAVMDYIDAWEFYLKGMVGVAGWFDIFMPMSVYWVWIGAAASLIVFALVVGGWRDRGRFMVMVFGGAVVPGILQVSQAGVVGFIIGGRYMMPLLVGMPMLAAYIVEQKVLNAKQSITMIKLFALVLLPVHILLLFYGMLRWQKGLGNVEGVGRFNIFAGEWHPPTGSVLPVVCMFAGVGVLFWMFWRVPTLAASLRAPSDTPSTDLIVDAAANGNNPVAAEGHLNGSDGPVPNRIEVSQTSNN